MKNKFDFQPKLVSALKNYSKEKFMTDLMAGIIVGIVALPLAIAFGIASGVSPEKGLITAILGGFFVSLLGGCNVQIGGPTGAFIVIVYGIIQNFGIEGLARHCCRRYYSSNHGGVETRNSYQVYPLPDRCRFHQWYRPHHFHHADERPFWADNG